MTRRRSQRVLVNHAGRKRKKKDKKKLDPVIWIPRFPHLIKWHNFFLHHPFRLDLFIISRKKGKKKKTPQKNRLLALAKVRLQFFAVKEGLSFIVGTTEKYGRFWYTLLFLLSLFFLFLFFSLCHVRHPFASSNCFSHLFRRLFQQGNPGLPSSRVLLVRGVSLRVVLLLLFD
jgi:hypothetical protein